MSWKNLPNVKGKSILKGDKVYVMNEYEKCALKLGKETKECYQIISSSNLNDADIWTVEFVYINDETGIRFKTNNVPIKKDRIYAMYGEWGSCRLMAMGKEKDNKNTVFILRDEKGNKVSEPMYGQSYTLTPLKYNSLKLKLDSSGNVSPDGLNNTEKWVILPTKDIPYEFVNKPMCYYLSNYSNNEGRCGKVNDLVNQCSGILRDYCSESENVFSGKSVAPGPCGYFLKQNPNGVADDAIETICFQDDNINREECACVGPTKNVAPTQDIPDYKLYWACYGNHCKKNINKAFVLNDQKTKQCPSQAICYFEKDDKNGVPRIVFGKTCEISDKEKNINKKDETNQSIKWLLIFSSLLIGGGLIWYFFKKDDKNKQRIDNNVNYPPYYYNRIYY